MISNIAIWISISVLALLGWRFFYSKWKRRPVSKCGLGFADFEDVFLGLDFNLDREAIVFLEHQNSDRFLQFAKRQSHDRGELYFMLPEVSWSCDALDLLEAECRKLGYVYSFRKDAGAKIARYFEVAIPFESDSEIRKSARFAEGVFRYMGLQEDDTFCAKFFGEQSHHKTLARLEESELKNTHPRLYTWMKRRLNSEK